MSFERVALAIAVPLSVSLLGQATGCSSDSTDSDSGAPIADAAPDAKAGDVHGVQCAANGNYYHCCTNSPRGNEAAPPTCVDGKPVCPSDQYVDSAFCENPYWESFDAGADADASTDADAN